MSLNAQLSQRPGGVVRVTAAYTVVAIATQTRWAVQPLLEKWRPLSVHRYFLPLLIGLNVALGFVWALSRQRSLQDLGSFLHSGAAYREGLNPYGYYSWLSPPPISSDALNLNPPISVYAFQALARFEPGLIQYAFLGSSVAFLGASVALLLREYPRERSVLTLLTILSLAGVWHTFAYLQIYAPLVLVVTVSWLLMRRGNLLLAGVAIGLVIAMKPNFAIWPLILLAAGHRQTPIAALATAATVSVIPLLLDGVTIYRQWLNLTMSFSGVEWTSNASIISLTSRLGSPIAGVVLTGALLAWLLARLRGTRPDLLYASSLAIPAVLLAGPASWAGYTLFLLPVLLSRRWTGPIWVSVLLLAVPFSLVKSVSGLGPIGNALAGPIYVWAVLLLLLTLVWERKQRTGQGLQQLPEAA